MNTPGETHDPGEAWLELVRRKVAGIRFGSVQIALHEGRVTQVEAVEKTRFVPEKPDRPQPGRR